VTIFTAPTLSHYLVLGAILFAVSMAGIFPKIGSESVLVLGKTRSESISMLPAATALRSAAKIESDHASPKTDSDPVFGVSLFSLPAGEAT
jgi:hypothetical protein